MLTLCEYVHGTDVHGTVQGFRPPDVPWTPPAVPSTLVPGADSEEKHEPVSDIDTVLVDSLKALDPKRPIREADVVLNAANGSFVP